MDFGRVADVNPAWILRQMRGHGVTTCTASPPFFDRLAEHVGHDPGSRPALRRILTGGAPVFDAQLRSWQQGFPDTEIVVVYGSTEAEPVAHIEATERMQATSDIRPRSPGYCVGRPTGQVKTRVIRIEAAGDATGGPADLPSHEVGELLVTGDHVCRSYFRNPEAVRENKLIDPAGNVWHRMGDTGYFDGQGRFWLVGRVHSTILRAGEQIHPQLVEQAAGTEDPRIRRAAAVGIPDPRLGERVVLVLETSGPQALGEEVQNRLEQAGQQVDEIVLLDEPLPVDPRHNSKIDYARLKARVQGLERQ
jgi:acyl-CoA synthetase (AMP-forming)/AMP-acid ligase II